MKCPDCKSGILSRNKKPDALGRTIQRCDTCNHRSVVSAPATVAPLLTPKSAPIARPPSPVQGIGPGAVTEIPARPSLAAPVAVVGQPCPCCHRSVRALPICVKCKKNRRVLGKTKCEECSRPKGPSPRFCVKCGTKFTPEKGKSSGSAGTHCPEHRTTRKRRRAAA